MKTDYLFVIPESEKLTRDYFVGLIRKFRHHRQVSYGFSPKHTQDILDYRRSVGADGESLSSSLYGIPVTWNTAISYIK